MTKSNDRFVCFDRKRARARNVLNFQGLLFGRIINGESDDWPDSGGNTQNSCRAWLGPGGHNGEAEKK